MNGYADWLADVLRDADCEIETYTGWKTRGARPFPSLTAVVWHHDASPPGDSPGVPDYMLRQMKARRAAAQLWVDRYGVWHILAAGVAFHAGNVRPGMPGNNDSLGVETDHTTGEKWPQAQVNSLRAGTAAILRRLGQDEHGLHMHKTICAPVGRKVDPDGLDLDLERVKVRELLRARSGLRLPAPAPAPLSAPREDDDMRPIVFEHDGSWWLRADGQTTYIPVYDDVRGLIELGAVDVRNLTNKLSAEMIARLHAGATR